MPVPPPDEQDAIGRFIHHLDQRVNRLIKTKRRLIELLNEQKQAIIHRAVTRGLDPNVPLKPSGIEWLGDIPSKWQVLGNRSLFTERRESGEVHLPLLEVSLRTGVRVASELDHFGRPRKDIEDRTKYQTARAGDIAYNMMRMWQGAVGVVPEDGLISPAYVVARVDDRLHPLFAELVFRTPMYMGAVNRYSKGIVSDRNRLYWDDFKQLPFLLPSTQEQSEVLAFLSESTSDLQSAITKAAAEIDFIREYRTRLVADVVTGQLDVRHLDLPEVDESLIEAIDAGEGDEFEDSVEDGDNDG
jgi:type I restriction enzyme S subunit